MQTNQNLQYLFRYSKNTSKKVKGVPLDIELYTVSAVTDADDEVGVLIPFAFKLTSMYKTYHFSCSTQEDRDSWITDISRARERAIKVRLGHVPQEAWEKHVNSAGNKLVELKAKQHNAELLTERNAVPY